jgi:hypothetical protein
VGEAGGRGGGERERRQQLRIHKVFVVKSFLSLIVSLRNRTAAGSSWVEQRPWGGPGQQTTHLVLGIVKNIGRH